MAHETIESAECQSVIYFIEVSNNKAPMSAVAPSPSSSAMIESTLADTAVEIDEPSSETPVLTALLLPEGGGGQGPTDYPTVESAQEQPTTDYSAVVLPEGSGSAVPADYPTVDVISTTPPEMPREFFLDLDSYGTGASKMASHLLDHMYSIICKPNCCRCGDCEEPNEAEGVDETYGRGDGQSGVEGGPRGQWLQEPGGGGRLRYQCLHCDYTASRRQHVKQHMATHLVDKPHKCLMCDYSASQKQSLVAHTLRFHYKRKPFKCDLCDYSAFRKQHVVVHMGKHMKEKPYKCDECDFQTSWKEYLSVHKKNLHPASKTFKPWRE